MNHFIFLLRRAISEHLEHHVGESALDITIHHEPASDTLVVKVVCYSVPYNKLMGLSESGIFHSTLLNDKYPIEGLNFSDVFAVERKVSDIVDMVKAKLTLKEYTTAE